jgi:hypothetical protein
MTAKIIPGRFAPTNALPEKTLEEEKPENDPSPSANSSAKREEDPVHLIALEVFSINSAAERLLKLKMVAPFSFAAAADDLAADLRTIFRLLISPTSSIEGKDSSE